MESTIGNDSQEDFDGLFSDMQLDSSKLGHTVKDRSAVMAKIIASLDEINFGVDDTKIDVLGNAYEYLNSLTPGVGATVKTPEGNAVVTDANLMTGYLTVRLTDSDSMPFKIHRDDVKRLSRFKKRPKRDSE